MKGKKYFTLDADLMHAVKKLQLDKAGELFMTILSYVNDEDIIVDDPIIDLLFEPIKQQLLREREEKGKLKGNFSKAGKASADARSLKNRQQLSVFNGEQDSPLINEAEHHSTELVKLNSVDIISEKQKMILIESIMSFFGFTELKQANKLFKISAFLKSLGSEKINHFEHQFDFYRKYKLVSKEKVHSFNNFIESGWDSENWQKKFTEYKQLNISPNGKSSKPQTTPVNSTRWNESKPRIPI